MRTFQNEMAASKEQPRFSIVIPVYNHAATLRSVIDESLQLGFPIIVVDDGSTDTCSEVLADYQGITVIRHAKNRGKGAALLTGIQAAARVADFAITLDADGQHIPRQALALIGFIRDGYRPLIVGRREHMLDDPGIPWTSRFGRKFSNFWVWASGGPSISDTQCGFRVYPIKEILGLRSRARRFQFEVEILVLAHWNNIDVYEVPIEAIYPDRSSRVSHFRPFTDFWRNAATFTRLITMRLLLPPSFRRRLIRA